MITCTSVLPADPRPCAPCHRTYSAPRWYCATGFDLACWGLRHTSPAAARPRCKAARCKAAPRPRGGSPRPAPRYVVEILSSNGCASRCWAQSTTGEPLAFIAFVDTIKNVGPVRVDNGREADHPVALFTSKREAEAVGLACRWNNQTYRVIGARGRVRAEGSTVARLDVDSIEVSQ